MNNVRTLYEGVTFAEEGAEDPAVGEVADEEDPHGPDGDEQVGGGQVDDVVVGCRPHLPRLQHDGDDEEVAHACHQLDGHNDGRLDGDLPVRNPCEVHPVGQITEVDVKGNTRHRAVWW